MKLRYSGLTDVGKHRDHNEDSLRLAPELNLFVLADGMGGHASGEVASRLAVNAAVEFMEASSEDPESTWASREDRSKHLDYNRLYNCLVLSNRSVFEASLKNSKYKGMGTTIVGLKLSRAGVFIGHVGDSRAYLIHNGSIKQLTEDHSLLNEYLKTKSMTAEEIENFPQKNVIVRALGQEPSVLVDMLQVTPHEGQIFLTCSDGLSGMISDRTILDIVSAHAFNLDAACQALIDAANDAGGDDNITVVLVAVDSL